MTADCLPTVYELAITEDKEKADGCGNSASARKGITRE